MQTITLKGAIPEDEGVSSKKLSEFVNRFFELEWPHGLVVLRHGRVIAEAYRHPCSPADRHQLFSLSKSFTSTAIGIALGEGAIKSLDEPIVSFFPEYDSPAIAPRMRRVTLRHLLTMSMGRESCGLWGDRYARLADDFRASPEASDMRAVASRFAHGDECFGNGRPWVRNLLEDDLPDEPGSVFTYNSAATFLAGAALQKTTGESLCDYLRPRLFDPLGISRDAAWDKSPEGLDRGGTGLNLTTREIAAAGQFWLRGGVLPDGRRIVPEGYFRAATSKQIENAGPGRAPDWSQGYGFQFWMCRHGAFRGDGASGQLAVMLPDQDAVVVVTAGLCNMQAELDVIWDSLLPAFGEAPSARDPRGLAMLRRAEHSQEFPFGPDGSPDSSVAPDGKIEFGVEANPYGVVSMSFEQDESGLTAELAFGDGHVDSLRAGWKRPEASCLGRLSQGQSLEAFAKAHWGAPGVLEMAMVAPRTTHFFNITLDFGSLTMRIRTPIWFSHPWLCDNTLRLVQARHRA